MASVLGLPLSFLMWYRNVYYATKTDGATFTYIKTMFYICVHMAWSVWTLLGIPGLGGWRQEAAGAVLLCVAVWMAQCA